MHNMKDSLKFQCGTWRVYSSNLKEENCVGGVRAGRMNSKVNHLNKGVCEYCDLMKKKKSTNVMKEIYYVRWRCGISTFKQTQMSNHCIEHSQRHDGYSL